jgi:hypothetical protein
MLRRLIAVAALAAGMSIAAAMTLATPAFAKGPSQASITGPGLVRAVVISGNGEPGEQGRLASLAEQTGLFTVMFGAGASISGPAPARLHTPPPKASLGPRYTLVYTVPGVTPRPGQQFGRVRQDLYPRAAGGPVIYTPPGQQGFGGPLTVTGWLRGRPQLTRTLAQLGVPSAAGTRAAPQASHPAAARPAAAHATAAHPAAAHQAGARTPGWIIAPAAAIMAAALVGAAFWLRRRRPAAADGQPRTSEPA